MAKYTHDCEMGESFTCEGRATITVIQKSGRKARITIESDSPIQFSRNKMAQECRDSLKEGDTHGTN